MRTVASALCLGLRSSAAGLFLWLWLWLWLLRTVPARVAASVQFLQPVFGIGASAAMFGDSMGPLFLAGVMLVLMGVGLSMINRRNRLQGCPSGCSGAGGLLGGRYHRFYPGFCFNGLASIT